MNLIQRLITFITAISLISGLIATIFLDRFSYTDLLIFYLFILTSSRLLYVGVGVNTLKKSAVNEVDGINNQNVSKKNHRVSNPVLFITRSVRPFTLFPDTIIIQEKSIIIVHKKFFMSLWSDTLKISDIGSVIMDNGPLFAALQIYLKLPTKEFTINYLPKHHAFAAKQLIDGLILLEDKKIALDDNLTVEEKIEVLRQVANEMHLEKQINEM